jgi:hypothetical protein
MALGYSAYVATTADTATYAHASGTSFSCPITTGAVGLLLQGHPEWTPADVIEALHSTATQSGSPDTLMGWGIAQASDAMHSEPSDVPENGVVAPRAIFASPNPFGLGTAVRYAVPTDAHVRVTVHDVAGRTVRVLFEGARRAGTYEAGWDGADAAGRQVASGIYFLKLVAGRETAVAKLVSIR